MSWINKKLGGVDQPRRRMQRRKPMTNRYDDKKFGDAVRDYVRGATPTVRNHRPNSPTGFHRKVVARNVAGFCPD